MGFQFGQNLVQSAQFGYFSLTSGYGLGMGRKGKVSIEAVGDRLRLRWRFGGNRFSLPVGLDNPIGRSVAQSLAAKIEADILTGNYDPTLKKYRIDGVVPKSIAVADLFARYCQRFDDGRGDDKHRAIARHLAREFRGRGVDSVTGEDAIGFFEGLNVAESTKTSYLTILKAVWKGQASQPWDAVEISRAGRAQSEPFSHDEVEKILAGFEGSYYQGFVKGLFGLGCRPGELAALTWADVDFIQGRVTINKSWSDRKRLVKRTKTGKIRQVPLSVGMRSYLQSLAQVEGLVFPGRKGGHINPKDFLCRHWQPTLKKVGVKYRPQYKSRHTVWSHAIAEGMPIAEASEYAGNRPETMMRHYLGRVTRSNMPEMF